MISDMKPIQISSIPQKLTLTFDQEKVTLPRAIRKKVDQHWTQLIESNPHLRNGEVFTITAVKDDSGHLEISLAETDYAHYLYSSQVGGLEEHAVRIIHPAVLVVSSDDKFIFGAMGEHTSRPGVIQFCGGGIDHEDVVDGIIDIEHNVVKELSEELGIDARDKSLVTTFYPAYLKSGGPTGKMTIVYILRLNVTAVEFLRNYEEFTQVLKDHGDIPEFGELFSIDNDADVIEAFIEKYDDRLNEFMPVSLRAACQDLTRSK
jgi:8-oxo-dGTP pyrophosphatase MutT (NUDIX family)